MADLAGLRAEAAELLDTPHFRYAKLPFDLRVRDLLERLAGLPGTVEPLRPGITLTREQLEDWTGHHLLDEEVEMLDECIPHSSIPEAIGVIVSEALGIRDPDEEEVDGSTP